MITPKRRCPASHMRKGSVKGGVNGFIAAIQNKGKNENDISVFVNMDIR